MGTPLHKDELREVAELPGVMDGDVFDLIDPSVRRECLQLVSNPERVLCLQQCYLIIIMRPIFLSLRQTL